MGGTGPMRECNQRLGYLRGWEWLKESMFFRAAFRGGEKCSIGGEKELC